MAFRFHDAAKAGNVQEVKQLLESATEKFDVLAPVGDAGTAIGSAFMRESLKERAELFRVMLPTAGFPVEDLTDEEVECVAMMAQHKRAKSRFKFWTLTTNLTAMSKDKLAADSKATPTRIKNFSSVREYWAAGIKEAKDQLELYKKEKNKEYLPKLFTLYHEGKIDEKGIFEHLKGDPEANFLFAENCHQLLKQVSLKIQAKEFVPSPAREVDELATLAMCYYLNVYFRGDAKQNILPLMDSLLNAKNVPDPHKEEVKKKCKLLFLKRVSKAVKAFQDNSNEANKELIKRIIILAEPGDCLDAYEIVGWNHTLAQAGDKSAIKILTRLYLDLYQKEKDVRALRLSFSFLKGVHDEFDLDDFQDVVEESKDEALLVMFLAFRYKLYHDSSYKYTLEAFAKKSQQESKEIKYFFGKELLASDKGGEEVKLEVKSIDKETKTEKIIRTKVKDVNAEGWGLIEQASDEGLADADIDMAKRAKEQGDFETFLIKIDSAHQHAFDFTGAFCMTQINCINILVAEKNLAAKAKQAERLAAINRALFQCRYRNAVLCQNRSLDKYFKLKMFKYAVDAANECGDYTLSLKVLNNTIAQTIPESLPKTELATNAVVTDKNGTDVAMLKQFALCVYDQLAADFDVNSPTVQEMKEVLELHAKLFSKQLISADHPFIEKIRILQSAISAALVSVEQNLIKIKHSPDTKQVLIESNSFCFRAAWQNRDKPVLLRHLLNVAFQFQVQLINQAYERHDAVLIEWYSSQLDIQNPVLARIIENLSEKERQDIERDLAKNKEAIASESAVSSQATFSSAYMDNVADQERVRQRVQQEQEKRSAVDRFAEIKKNVPAVAIDAQQFYQQKIAALKNEVAPNFPLMKLVYEQFLLVVRELLKTASGAQKVEYLTLLDIQKPEHLAFLSDVMPVDYRIKLISMASAIRNAYAVKAEDSLAGGVIAHTLLGGSRKPAVEEKKEGGARLVVCS